MHNTQQQNGYENVSEIQRHFYKTNTYQILQTKDTKGLKKEFSYKC